MTRVIVSPGVIAGTIYRLFGDIRRLFSGPACLCWAHTPHLREGNVQCISGGLSIKGFEE